MILILGLPFEHWQFPSYSFKPKETAVRVADVISAAQMEMEDGLDSKVQVLN